MKSTRLLVIFLALLVFPTASVQSREPAEDARERSAILNTPGEIALGVLIIEALAVVNAGLATASPEIYGGAALLLSPFVPFAGEHVYPSTRWVGAASLAGIGIYNLAVLSDDDEYSQQDVFVHNVVAWNLAFIGMGIAEILSSKSSRHSFGVTPLDGGLLLAYRHNF